VFLGEDARPDLFIVVHGRNLGIETVQRVEKDSDSFRALAILMFDTKLPPGVAIANPFADDSVLNEISVKVPVYPSQQPKQLFSFS
jgi:hypothetical protein